MCRCGVVMPVGLRRELSGLVRSVMNSTDAAWTEEQVASLFQGEYLGNDGAYVYVTHEFLPSSARPDARHLRLKVKFHGQGALLRGSGITAVEATVDALGLCFNVAFLQQRCIRTSARLQVMTFVRITIPPAAGLFGVGLHDRAETAMLLAVLGSSTIRCQRLRRRSLLMFGVGSRLQCPAEFERS